MELLSRYGGGDRWLDGLARGLDPDFDVRLRTAWKNCPMKRSRRI